MIDKVPGDDSAPPVASHPDRKQVLVIGGVVRARSVEALYRRASRPLRHR